MANATATNGTQLLQELLIMKKEALQVTISVPEKLMLALLAKASGHNASMIAARAITEWLQRNYRDQMDLYGCISPDGSCHT